MAETIHSLAHASARSNFAATSYHGVLRTVAVAAAGFRMGLRRHAAARYRQGARRRCNVFFVEHIAFVSMITQSECMRHRIACATLIYALFATASISYQLPCCNN